MIAIGKLEATPSWEGVASFLHGDTYSQLWGCRTPRQPLKYNLDCQSANSGVER